MIGETNLCYQLLVRLVGFRWIFYTEQQAMHVYSCTQQNGKYLHQFFPDLKADFWGRLPCSQADPRT